MYDKISDIVPKETDNIKYNLSLVFIRLNGLRSNVFTSLHRKTLKNITITLIEKYNELFKLINTLKSIVE